VAIFVAVFLAVVAAGPEVLHQFEEILDAYMSGP
jgi:hypothetical protein